MAKLYPEKIFQEVHKQMRNILRTDEQLLKKSHMQTAALTVTNFILYMLYILYYICKNKSNVIIP